MFRHNSSSERGQSMIIIAVFMVALIGMLALVLDGGLGYAKRRQSQNAADAAALAGADALCDSDPAPDARTVAEEYVVLNGGSDPANEDIIIGEREITVTAYVSHPTFFAGIFGSEEITAAATATAGCFVPCDAYVVPIAWACQPPVGGVIDDACAIDYGTLTTPGPLYVIMDSKSVNTDFVCQDPPNSGLPVGTLDCDLDNDGANELLAYGNRSWLDLDGGGGGANELKDWMAGSYDDPISIHTWFGGQPGTTDVVYQVAATRIDQIVFLPVFDAFCEGWPSTECPDAYHFGPDPIDTVVASGGANQLYFHVIAFSPFRITCVSAKPSDHCPGKSAAMAANPGVIKNNTRTIEGYFIHDYYGTGACDGPAAGAYTIYLK
jgi:hypothetical protein